MNLASHNRRCCRRTDIGLRQVERKGAAFAGGTAELDFSTQKARQFAADGKTKSGSAVFAAGACIGLLEGLKDDSLFVQRNADAGIGNRECNHRSAGAENGMILRPAFRS